MKNDFKIKQLELVRNWKLFKISLTCQIEKYDYDLNEIFLNSSLMLRSKYLRKKQTKVKLTACYFQTRLWGTPLN